METREYFEKVMQDYNQNRNGRSLRNILSSLRWKAAICPLIVIEERHDSTKRTSTMVLAAPSFLLAQMKELKKTSTPSKATSSTTHPPLS